MTAEQQSTAWMILGALTVVGGSYAVYWSLRMLKGSLRLELESRSVALGQILRGKLHLQARKPVVVDRFYVALVGERRVNVRARKAGSHFQYEWVEFYRKETDVPVDGRLPAGFSETYGFELSAPSREAMMTGSEALAQLGKAVDDKLIGAAISFIGSMSSHGEISGPKRWKVMARLETKGVDLAASQSVSVIM